MAGATTLYNLPYASPGDPADGAGNEQSMMSATELAIRGGFVVKPSNQTITSSTTMTNDTALFLPAVANATYLVDLDIFYGGLAAAGIKFGFTIPASASLSWTVGAMDPAVTTARVGGAVWTFLTGGDTASVGVNTVAGNALIARPHCILVTGASSGTIRLQWAQTTSNATGSVVYNGSQMYSKRIA